MKKWIFCTKRTYLKILKAKDQLQLGSQAMIHHVAIFNKLGWSMWGSSFKQITLSRSLENEENCTYGFVLLASVKSSCSNCLREKSQLFWSHSPQLSFSTSQRVKRTNCVQKVILIKNRLWLSQCTGKQNNVMKNEKNSDYYYLGNRKMILGKLAGLLFPRKFNKRTSLLTLMRYNSNLILWLNTKIKLVLQR